MNLQVNVLCETRHSLTTVSVAILNHGLEVAANRNSHVINLNSSLLHPFARRKLQRLT